MTPATHTASGLEPERTVARGAARRGDRRPPRPASWREMAVDAASVPTRLLADWEQLAGRCQLPVVAGPHWTSCYQRAFVPPGEGLVFGLYRGDRLVGAVPLVRRGRLSRVLASMDNVHSPIWSFALDTSEPRVAEELLGRLLARADWLSFDRLRRSDPVWRALAGAAGSRGLACSICEYSGDSCVELGDRMEELISRWSPRMAKEARRRLRQRAENGELSVERVEAPEGLAEVLDECFALEARTWKGANHTAVADDPAARAFYEDLAYTMAREGALALYLLRHEGELMAFDYGLRGGRRLDSLKIAYDPEHARLSPGNLLTLELLGREIAEGRVGSVHLGRPSSYKARFVTSIDPLVSLRVYGRGVRARAAFLGGPALHSRLKEIPWLVSLHRRADRLAPAIERAWRRVRTAVTRAPATIAPAGGPDRAQIGS